MFFFSPCSSKMLCFLFWLNDRLPPEEDVKIAVIEKKSWKESFYCRKQTPQVQEMGETGVWYGPWEAHGQPLQGLLLCFISSVNLPRDLERKVGLRGNSAPYWHKKF